jgi:hypothetical protein
MGERSPCRRNVRVRRIVATLLAAGSAAADPPVAAPAFEELATARRPSADPPATDGRSPAPAFAWDAPEACPARADVEVKIVSRLGAPLEGLSQHVAVAVTRADTGDAGYVAHLELDSPAAHEVRTLAATSCGELAEAVSVIVARLAHSYPAPATEPRRARVGALDADEHAIDTMVAAPAGSTAHWSAGARFAALAGYGMLPQLGIGGEVAAWIELGPASLEIARDGWSNTRRAAFAPTYDVDGLSVDFTATVARIGWKLGDLPLRARASGELGTMTGRGVGALAGSERPLRWIGAGAGVAADWRPAPWLRVMAAGDIVFAIQRARFALLDGTQVYEAGPLSARFSVGLEVGIP